MAAIKDQGNEVKFDDVKALAERLDVSMNAACLRADIAYSTPHRWGKGSKPDPTLIARLRAAIILIAHERDDLPDELAGEVQDASSMIPSEASDPHRIVAGIEQDLRRLKRSLKASGVQASAS